MKTRNIFLFFILISLFTMTAAVHADGNTPYWYTQPQQTYPIPQLYPIGQIPQQNTQPRQSQPRPSYPVYPDPQQPQPRPSYPVYPEPQQPEYKPYPNQGPIYDPWSGLYFYPINEDDPYQNQNPYQNQYPNRPYEPYQPYYPGNGYSNVQVNKQWSYNGSINLTWTITNTTNEYWDKKNIDIKCTSGCHLLTKPERTLWDLPYSVNRGGQLSFTVNIWPPMYSETMSFAIIAGSKTLYQFSVNPN